MQIAIGALIVGVAALVWYLTTRAKTAPDVPPDVPPISEEDDRVTYLLGVIEKLLAEARASKYEAQIAEQAALIKKIEATLAELQAAAILYPRDTDIQQQVEKAEEEARKERAMLEMQWAADLDLKVTAMKQAESLAKQAYSVYLSAAEKITYWIKKANAANFGVQRMNELLQTTTNKTLREAYLREFNNYVAQVKDYRNKAVKAQLDAVTVYSKVVLAISKADDLVGDVLALTRDMQNLGILLALADRTDSIAKATRTKLAQMERATTDPNRITIPTYPIPEAPPTQPEPTVGMTYEEAVAEAKRTGGTVAWSREKGWYVIPKGEVPITPY